MTYEEFINNILETRGRNGCGDEYHETHHIVPKCMGGTNDKENLIDLFAREHFEAHRLLALENPEEDGLVYAWWNMSHMNKANGRNYEITAEEYEEAKKAFSKLASDNAKQYIGNKNPNFGNNKLSNDNNPRCRPVMCVETGEIGYGAKYFVDKYGMSQSNIWRCCNNICATTRGYHFCYMDNPTTIETINVVKNNKEKETRQKKSESHKGAKNYQTKPIQCIETGEILWGATAFEQKYGFNHGSIIACCRGKRKTHKGYHWRYANEVEQENLKGEKL